MTKNELKSNLLFIYLTFHGIYTNNKIGAIGNLRLNYIMVNSKAELLPFLSVPVDETVT